MQATSFVEGWIWTFSVGPDGSRSGRKAEPYPGDRKGRTRYCWSDGSQTRETLHGRATLGPRDKARYPRTRTFFWPPLTGVVIPGETTVYRLLDGFISDSEVRCAALYDQPTSVPIT